MEGFCRACLVKYDQPTDLLQYTEKNRRLYVYSTGIQVKRNDVFTFQLCKDCYLKMKLACKFKKLCRTSDKNIKKYQALKDGEEDVDFCSFLKNTDDSFAFRFPLLSSNSTPAYHRSKDDDNDSTCTSIRNFMRDLLPPEDIPDTEAQIIRQVIEEEADILDDSLDSHWLQDDTSIDTDFQLLDFSFSPFSTPRRAFNDQCYSPARKVNENSQDIAKLLESPVKVEKLELESETNIVYEYVTNDVDLEEQVPRFEAESLEQVIVESKTEIVDYQDSAPQDVIDKNLDRALKDKENNEFSLDDLLVTPPAGSTVSTPTIHNILFGDKSENDQLGQYIEKYDNVEGDSDIDIFDEFSYYKDNDQQSFTAEKSESENMADKYDLTDFSCKLCDNKKFKDVRALNIHFFKRHKVSIKGKRKSARKKIVCDICAHTCYDRPNMLRHIKAKHTKRTGAEPKCEHCGQTFAFESRLKMHMKTHVKVQAEPLKEKTHTCGICGVSYAKGYSLTLHIRTVHEGAARLYCNDCGKGFQRKADLLKHIRSHNGERPFPCLYCEKKFSRRDTLTRHIKCHTNENRFKCCYCNKHFKAPYALRKHIEISESCMRVRLEEKLKADDKDPAVKRDKRTRYFVLRPRPLESLMQPKPPNIPTNEIDTTHESTENENHSQVEKIAVPTEVVSEIDQDMPDVAQLAQNRIGVNEESMSNDNADAVSEYSMPTTMLSLPMLI